MPQFPTVARAVPHHGWIAAQPTEKSVNVVVRMGRMLALAGSMIYFGLFALIVTDNDWPKPLRPLYYGYAIASRCLLWLALLVVLGLFVIPGLICMRLGEALHR